MRRWQIGVLIAAVEIAMTATVMSSTAVAAMNFPSPLGCPIGYPTCDPYCIRHACPNLAAMSGRNEIGPNGKRRAGDLDGVGSFAAVIDKETNQLCSGITVREIGTPVAAHIHKGKRGKNGPIVITLTAPTTGDPGASSGCVGADPKLLTSIRKRPHTFYVNVHTADVPNGAVRGQLFQARAR